MTPEQQRKYNTIFGSVFLGVGVVAWLLTAYFAVTPNTPRPFPVLNAPSIDLPSCRNALSTLGYQVSVTGNDVTAFEALTDNPKQQLERATLAASICKIPLKSFCMGEGCEQPGVTIVVSRPNDPSVRSGGKDTKAAANPAAPTPAAAKKPAPAHN